MRSWRFLAALAALLTLVAAGPARAETSLLNVSYDVSRELYKEINPLFAASWQASKGEAVTIRQSHGGSSKQALAVAAGLEADVVTMNQASDLEFLAERGFVAPDWRSRFPHGAAPYTSTMVFLVRRGNPKAIRDWDDLVREGVQVIVPNPKVTGNGRYTYLAAWGYARQKTGSDEGARAFVATLFRNVPVLDGGGRGATTTFTQRGVGDVLVTFENEARLIAQELGGKEFEIVYPSVSIEAPAPVAVVEPVVAKRGTAEVARAYLQFLFSEPAQEVMAKHYFRPSDPQVRQRHAARFPAVRTFTVEEVFGGWAAVQRTHFADGGVLDQILGQK
ncbi:sulfate ABC transporter substrate-binding protein [Tepidiphilus sp. HLB4]